MKNIVYVLTMCLGLTLFVQAEAQYDLDDVTIEVVEEGEEIAHQISLPPMPIEGLERVSPVEERKREDSESDDSVAVTEADGASEDSGDESMKDDGKQPETPGASNSESAQNDEFLELIGEAEDLEALMEEDEREAVELADEMLQQAAEEMHEVEEQVETTSEEVEADQRDETALIEEIRHYEEEKEEEGDEEPEVIDEERDEEQGVGGASSEAALE